MCASANESDATGHECDAIPCNFQGSRRRTFLLSQMLLHLQQHLSHAFIVRFQLLVVRFELLDGVLVAASGVCVCASREQRERVALARGRAYLSYCWRKR